jgi:hypothetical protein
MIQGKWTSSGILVLMNRRPRWQRPAPTLTTSDKLILCTFADILVLVRAEIGTSLHIVAV